MGIFERLGKKLPESAAGPVEYIIAGLGNPGDKYERTRHNAGFIAIDILADSLGVTIKRLKFRAVCGDAVISGKRVLLLKPQTFMNLSGESIREAAAFYKVPPERVIILCDDVSLPAGKLRIRRKGSDGGHNGLKSIIYQLSSDAFPRVKIGVGAPPREDYDMAAWVLGSFPQSDREMLEKEFTDAAEAAKVIIAAGVDAAMQKYN